MGKKNYIRPTVLLVDIKGGRILAAQSMKVGNGVVTQDNQVFSRRHTGWFDDEEGDESSW